jgi:hypothetical protein
MKHAQGKSNAHERSGAGHDGRGGKGKAADSAAPSRRTMGT